MLTRGAGARIVSPASNGGRILCWLVGHQYRNRVPEVFRTEVYCLRCQRVFGSFDSPFTRRLWETDEAARRKMMGLDW